MARVRIIVAENRVNVDGDSRIVDLAAAGLDPDIAGVEWNDTTGLVLFKRAARRRRARELGQIAITDFTPFQPIVDAWQTAPAPPAPVPVASNPLIQPLPASVDTIAELREAINRTNRYLRGQ